MSSLDEILSQVPIGEIAERLGVSEDEADGRKIVGNIFCGQTDQVVSQLGGVGGGSQGALVGQLLAILSPIVLSWLTGRVGGGGGLGGLLGGAPAGAGAQGGAAQAPVTDGGNPLQDVLASVTSVVSDAHSTGRGQAVSLARISSRALPASA